MGKIVPVDRESNGRENRWALYTTEYTVLIRCFGGVCGSLVRMGCFCKVMILIDLSSTITNKLHIPKRLGVF